MKSYLSYDVGEVSTCNSKQKSSTALGIGASGLCSSSCCRLALTPPFLAGTLTSEMRDFVNGAQKTWNKAILGIKQSDTWGKWTVVTVGWEQDSGDFSPCQCFLLPCFVRSPLEVVDLH